MNGYFVSADVDLYHITLTRQEGYRVVRAAMWHAVEIICSYAMHWGNACTCAGLNRWCWTRSVWAEREWLKSSVGFSGTRTLKDSFTSLHGSQSLSVHFFSFTCPCSLHFEEETYIFPACVSPFFFSTL